MDGYISFFKNRLYRCKLNNGTRRWYVSIVPASCGVRFERAEGRFAFFRKKPISSKRRLTKRFRIFLKKKQANAAPGTNCDQDFYSVPSEHGVSSSFPKERERKRMLEERPTRTRKGSRFVTLFLNFFFIFKVCHKFAFGFFDKLEIGGVAVRERPVRGLPARRRAAIVSFML